MLRATTCAIPHNAHVFSPSAAVFTTFQGLRHGAILVPERCSRKTKTEPHPRDAAFERPATLLSPIDKASRTPDWQTAAIVATPKVWKSRSQSCGKDWLVHQDVAGRLCIRMLHAFHHWASSTSVMIKLEDKHYCTQYRLETSLGMADHSHVKLLTNLFLHGRSNSEHCSRVGPGWKGLDSYENSCANLNGQAARRLLIRNK